MPVPREAPRLVKMINDPTLGVGGTAIMDLAPLLETILRQIDLQLKKSLDDAVWDAIPGLRLNQSSLDEQWARLYAELVTFLPYITPGGLYGTSDIDVYNSITQGEKFYPLGFECQQHSTMGLILRGFNTNDFSVGCNAGNSKGIPLFHGGSGTWIDLSSGTPAEILDKGAKPGTLVEFWATESAHVTNRNPDHIALIVRTHEPDDGGDPRAIQFFDTGAITIDNSFANRMAGVTATTGGLCEDPWCIQSCTVSGDGLTSGATGIGITPDTKVPVGLTLGRSLFPLGVARLVIRNRVPLEPGGGSGIGPPLRPDTILFATPLLRMHTAADNFAVSRYAWSLRKHFNCDTFEVRWQISTPRKPPPGVRAFDSLTPLRSRDKILLRDFDDSVFPKSKKIRDLNLCKLLDVVSQPDGTIKIERYTDYRFAPTRTDDDPWDDVSGVLGLSHVPEYMLGGATLPDTTPIPSDSPPPSGPGRADPPPDPNIPSSTG